MFYSLHEIIESGSRWFWNMKKKNEYGKKELKLLLKSYREREREQS